jgi:hypothetical protein
VERLTPVRVRVVVKSKTSPPIRITPPWIIIKIGIGLMMILWPKVDLFA